MNMIEPRDKWRNGAIMEQTFVKPIGRSLVPYGVQKKTPSVCAANGGKVTINGGDSFN